MVTEETIWRSRTILARGDVFITSHGPSSVDFLVRQRNGQWAAVYARLMDDSWVWSCNAVEGNQGCVLFTGDRTTPFCSHTLAALKHWEALKNV